MPSTGLTIGVDEDELQVKHHVRVFEQVTQSLEQSPLELVLVHSPLTIIVFLEQEVTQYPSSK